MNNNEDDFIVIAVDGDFRNFMEAETEYLKYEGLSWDEVKALCYLSFRQGYQCVVWHNEENRSEGDRD